MADRALLGACRPSPSRRSASRPDGEDPSRSADAHGGLTARSRAVRRPKPAQDLRRCAGGKGETPPPPPQQAPQRGLPGLPPCADASLVQTRVPRPLRAGDPPPRRGACPPPPPLLAAKAGVMRGMTRCADKSHRRRRRCDSRLRPRSRPSRSWPFPTCMNIERPRFLAGVAAGIFNKITFPRSVFEVMQSPCVERRVVSDSRNVNASLTTAFVYRFARRTPLYRGQNVGEARAA